MLEKAQNLVRFFLRDFSKIFFHNLSTVLFTLFSENNNILFYIDYSFSFIIKFYTLIIGTKIFLVRYVDNIIKTWRFKGKLSTSDICYL